MTTNYLTCVNHSLLKCIILIVCIISLTSCKQEQTNKEQVQKTQAKQSVQPSETDTKTGEKYILFFGNSLTAGYGLEEEEAFPSLIQERIDSLGLNYKVVNAGLSGETTAGGKNRISWVLKQPVDIFILELGANDVLRGFELSSTESNLRSIIEEVRSKKPEAKIILLGMLAPQNLGEEYTESFAAIYPKLAKEYNTGLVPFLLDGVATNKELNLPDGIHPNAKGQKIVMENVWRELKEYL